jgi:cyclohexyl-isocyanide hydratase
MVRRIAFFVFPRVTLLDFVGVYDALRRVPDVELRVIGSDSPVGDDGGARVLPHGVYEDLAPYDLLIVPGGLGERVLIHDTRAIDYLRGWGETRPIASVCTGALLLGAAGHLAVHRATTHFDSYDRLQPYCREVVRGARVVDDGRVVTAGAVSSAIDLGLHLVGKYWGEERRGVVARAMHVGA